jgi:hypothetical protein
MQNIIPLVEVSLASREHANDRQFLRITLPEAVSVITIDIREQRGSWSRFQRLAKVPEVQTYIADLRTMYGQIEDIDTSDYEQSVTPDQATAAP